MGTTIIIADQLICSDPHKKRRYLI